MGDVTASRGDPSVDFEINLDCRPSRDVTVYYVVAREGVIGSTTIVTLTSSAPTATVAVSVGSTQDLALRVVWAPAQRTIPPTARPRSPIRGSDQPPRGRHPDVPGAGVRGARTRTRSAAAAPNRSPATR